MKIGIIRERKSPPDSRVPLTPQQCQLIMANSEINIEVEPSPIRCYKDEEYLEAGVTLSSDLSDRDVLLGVKELIPENVLPGKTYFIFSHTIKEQAYNRNLLKAFIENEVRLIDYEVLTDDSGRRLIAFGYFAGLVGAHNALWTWCRRTELTRLPRLYKLPDFRSVIPYYDQIKWPAFKIVLTGDGRVASGSVHTLEMSGIKRVSPEDFLTRSYDEAIYTQLGVKAYARRTDGLNFELDDYFSDPGSYESQFLPYARQADIMINGIYWDPRSPAFFSLEDMAKKDFKIKVIADVTCDIAPEASIPSTIRPTTIDDPVYGFDPDRKAEVEPFQAGGIDVMAIDNLPNEVPRDASESFGQQFIDNILPELLKDSSDILEQATIAQNGKLGVHFKYLKNFLEGHQAKGR